MQEHTHLELKLLTLLRSCARKVAKKFNLHYHRIDLFPLDDPDRSVCRGLCYSDGYIYLNPRKRNNGKFDTVESALDTLIHELAHLKNDKHDRKFWQDHQKMKRWFWKNHY